MSQRVQSIVTRTLGQFLAQAEARTSGCSIKTNHAFQITMGPTQSPAQKDRSADYVLTQLRKKRFIN